MQIEQQDRVSIITQNRTSSLELVKNRTCVLVTTSADGWLAWHSLFSDSNFAAVCMEQLDVQRSGGATIWRHTRGEERKGEEM
jgi:hypothetical protein